MRSVIISAVMAACLHIAMLAWLPPFWKQNKQVPVVPESITVNIGYKKKPIPVKKPEEKLPEQEQVPEPLPVERMMPDPLPLKPDLPEPAEPALEDPPTPEEKPDPLPKLIKKKVAVNKKKVIQKIPVVKPVSKPEIKPLKPEIKAPQPDPPEIKEKVVPEPLPVPVEKPAQPPLPPEPLTDTSQQPPAAPEKTDKPEKKQIEFARPLYKKNIPPPYPAIARKRGYQGTVELSVFITAEGIVEKLEISQSSGHRILDRQALKYVKKWLFEPGSTNQVPTPMWVKVPVTFKLK